MRFHSTSRSHDLCACLDEDLDGDAFVGPLREAGIDLVRHRESFSKGVADVVWIPLVAEQGLIILSANTGMRLKPLEVAAIRDAGARVLYLRQTRNTTHPQLAALFIRSIRRVERFFALRVGPRVGALKQLSHGRDPLRLAPGEIEVPSAFR